MEIQAKIAKRDDDKQLVFGIASRADITDLHGDRISAEVLEKAVYDFVTHSRQGREMHQRGKVADLVESFFITPEKAKILGVDESYINHWYVGFKINDADVWSKIKNGTYSMFSIGGIARRNDNE